MVRLYGSKPKTLSGTLSFSNFSVNYTVGQTGSLPSIGKSLSSGVWNDMGIDIGYNIPNQTTHRIILVVSWLCSANSDCKITRNGVDVISFGGNDTFGGRVLWHEDTGFTKGALNTYKVWIKPIAAANGWSSLDIVYVTDTHVVS